MLCVKFPQVQYLDFSETVHVLKAVAVLTSEHLKLSTVFVVNHLLSAKVTPEWRSNLASPKTSFGVRLSRIHFWEEMNAWQTNPTGRLRGG